VLGSEAIKQTPQPNDNSLIQRTSQQKFSPQPITAEIQSKQQPEQLQRKISPQPIATQQPKSQPNELQSQDLFGEQAPLSSAPSSDPPLIEFSSSAPFPQPLPTIPGWQGGPPVPGSGPASRWGVVPSGMTYVSPHGVVMQGVYPMMQYQYPQHAGFRPMGAFPAGLNRFQPVAYQMRPGNSVGSLNAKTDENSMQVFSWHFPLKKFIEKFFPFKY
jgi:hypothetical protein